MFLSWGRFPERGAGRPESGPNHRLAVSVSSAIGHHFHKRSLLSARCFHPAYSRGAAILSRERPGAFLVPSRPPLLSSWTYRLALPPNSYRLFCGRSRTFIGQCCLPFCPGDPTNHSGGPHTVTKSRCEGGRISPSGLHQAWELGPPSEPKRDTSRTISTWPLRRRLLPPDAGCVPRIYRVRVESSERAWTRPGRIRLHSSPFW